MFFCLCTDSECLVSYFDAVCEHWRFLFPVLVFCVHTWRFWFRILLLCVVPGRFLFPVLLLCVHTREFLFRVLLLCEILARNLLLCVLQKYSCFLFC